MTAETITCPKCGHPNAEGARDCANCGITFEIYVEIKEAAKREQAPPKKKAAPPAEMAICPKCQHPNNPLSLDCLKCGIVFSKYFESMEMELAEAPEKEAELQKLRATRDAMEALRRKKEEEARQEALRKRQEEQERIEALKRERQEELRRQEEEERKRQEELRRRQEAEEKRRQEEAERQKEDEEKRRQEEIELQKKEEEHRRQEELRRQQEEEEKKRQEEIERKKEKEERRRQEAIDRQKEEEDLKRREEAERKKAEEELKRREEMEKQRAAEEAEAQRQERLAELMKPKGTLRKLLKNYSDQVVGMNYDAPTVYKPVRLVNVNDDHFSVLIENDELVYSYPMSNILALIEGVDGVRTAVGREKAVFPLVIRVSHRVM